MTHYSLPACLVAFDCEATGLEPGSRLIELAAVCFNPEGQVTGRFQRLVDPGMGLPPDIVELTGVTRMELASAGDAAACLDAFLDWLPEGAVLCAHNIRFDLRLLGYEADHSRRQLPAWPLLDSMALARAWRHGATSLRLHDLADHLALNRDGKAHRAATDAEITRRLVLRSLPELTSPRHRRVLRPFHFVGDWRRPRAWPAGFEQLPVWQRRGTRITIVYSDRAGRTTERQVTIYGFAQTARGLQFHGWCHLRNARRNFFVERCRLLDAEPSVGGPLRSSPEAAACRRQGPPS